MATFDFFGDDEDPVPTLLSDLLESPELKAAAACHQPCSSNLSWTGARARAVCQASAMHVIHGAQPMRTPDVRKKLCARKGGTLGVGMRVVMSACALCGRVSVSGLHDHCRGAQ